MKQKIFLTSCIAMGVIAPAMAEPTNTGTFPSDGYMQEDYTYTNAATADNMDSVYEGEVNAVAEYDIIDYIVNAGQYLPADSETVITCPAGSFCPGISGNVQYNQSSDQGIQTCPTGYASSAAGASSDTQCYRQCSGNVTIEHATGVTGNDYYGNGADTCEPTGCVAGWHKKDGDTLLDIIGQTSAENSAYIDANGSFLETNFDEQGVKGQSYYALVDNNTWVVDYGNKGMVYGQYRCSTRGVTTPWYQNNLTFTEDHFVNSVVDETGQEGAGNCYCNVTGYKPNGDVFQSVESSWMFIFSNSASSCALGDCAYKCANGLTSTRGVDSRAIRNAMFGAVAPIGLATCEANTITINWSDASAADVSANNAGTATYGSDVRTPVKAQTIKGKTFRGWRFSKPEQTNLP